MVLNATVVTAAGDVHQRLIATARSSHGPELRQLLYGSEGNLGMIVSDSPHNPARAQAS
jgi:FAD/FMN-containing dehydrogenase